MNQVNIAGNVTADVKTTVLSTGNEIANFSIAINKKYKNKAGEEIKEVSFIEIKAFRWACHIAKGLKKGDMITVSGEIKQERWEDATTKQNRSKIVIIAFLIAVVPKTENKTETTQPEDAVPF
jgi:single-strand DNA-binding protein